MSNAIKLSPRERKMRFSSEYKSFPLTANATKVKEFNGIIHAQ